MRDRNMKSGVVVPTPRQARGVTPQKADVKPMTSGADAAGSRASTTGANACPSPQPPAGTKSHEKKGY